MGYLNRGRSTCGGFRFFFCLLSIRFFLFFIVSRLCIVICEPSSVSDDARECSILLVCSLRRGKRPIYRRVSMFMRQEVRAC